MFIRELYANNTKTKLKIQLTPYRAHRIILLQPVAGCFLYRVTGEGPNVQINNSVMLRKVREVLLDLLATSCLRTFAEGIVGTKIKTETLNMSVFFQMNYV